MSTYDVIILGTGYHPLRAMPGPTAGPTLRPTWIPQKSSCVVWR